MFIFMLLGKQTATLELSRKLKCIPVQHWDRCVKKSIKLPSEADADAYTQLLCDVLLAFQEEIESCPFRIYYLPYDFKDIEDKVRISSTLDLDRFSALYIKMLNANKGLPLLFVFNTSEDSESPLKLPVPLPTAKEESISTVVSRNSVT